MALYMTPREVAERWNCSTRHVQRLCAGGDLRALRLGLEKWRIAVADVEAYELAQTNGATVAPATAVANPPRRLPSCDAGAEYEPIVKGRVPWRTEVIGEARPASQRAAEKKKTGSVSG